MGFFREFYKHKKFVRNLNTTFVVLIPKKGDVEDLKDFRPISLVGGLYKLLAKVLANRLKRVIEKVISLAQNAFVEGRQILNAAFIANEGVDSWLRRKESGMLCKLDIANAYDHISRDFILMVLENMRFRTKWLQWIKWCISTTTFSILVNDSSAGFFRSTRGLRQGRSTLSIPFHDWHGMSAY